MPSTRTSVRPDLIWRSAREPLFWLDGGFHIAWVNPALEALTGHSADAVIGAACLAHGPSGSGDPLDLAATLSPPAEARAGRCCATRSHLVSPNGDRRRILISYQPFHDEQGALLGLLGRIHLDEEPEASALGGESEADRLRVRLMDVRAELQTRYGVDSLIGEGPAHRRLLEQIRIAAGMRRPVLLTGEPGTGKRHAARLIHHLGAESGAALKVLDCEALPPNLLDRELFGVASVDDSPMFEPPRLVGPEGASILIGDLLALPRDLQAKAATALNAGEGRVRLLAVSSGDPETAVREGGLREDLYLALSIFTIRLLPLRDRLDEIPLLAQSFLERLNVRGERQRLGFTRTAEETLSAYHWPGNLRELARVVEHAHARGGSGLVEVEDLPADVRGHLADAYPPPKPVPPRPLDEILTEVERRLIENALVRSRRNKSRAAEILGVSRPRLYRRLKELGFPDVDQE